MTEPQPSQNQVISFTKLANTCPTAIIKVNKEGRIVYANDKVEEILGLKESEIKSRTYNDPAWKKTDFEGNEFPEEDLPFKIVRETEEAVSNVRLAVKKPSGRRKYLSVNASPIFDDSGNFKGTVAIVEDITERKQLAEGLQTSEKIYRKLFEVTSTAMLIIEEDTTISLVNKEVEKLTRYLKEEIEGKMSWTELVAREDQLEEMKEHHSLRQEDPDSSPNRYEFKLVDKYGTKKKVLMTIDLIPGTEKNVASMSKVTEKKEAKRKLWQSEKKYRQIFNNANDAMYLHELTEEGIPGPFLEVNDVACEMLGYSREEFLSLSPQDIDGGQTAQDLPTLMEDLLAQGHKTFEMHHEAKSGRLVPVEISSHIVEIDGEKRVLSIARDISERKELQRRQKLFSSSLEQASLGVYWVKSDGRFAYTNKKVEEILDYSEEELTGMYVWDVDPNPEHAEDKRERRWKMLKEEGTLNFETVHQTKDGQKFPVEITSTYIKHKGEEYEIVFAKEITERKKAKKELQKSEKKFRSYVENAPVGVVVVNEKGQFVEVNKVAGEMTGYPQEELLGMGILDLTPPEAAGEAQQAFENLLDQGEAQGELPYFRKDETKGYMVVNAVKISENRYLGFTLDITERKEAKRKLKEATLETLQALNRTIEAKDEYTGEHIDRVQRLSVETGKKFGLSEKRMEQLRYASILHDIGKIGVHDSILGKPGGLTEEERIEMKKHPQVGERIVGQVDRLDRAAKIVGQHQEKYDGSGYPKGLEGEEITLEARILAVADAWDAMRSDRPYRDALPKKEAIKELEENKGTQFDPEIVDIVLEMVENDKVEFGKE